MLKSHEKNTVGIILSTYMYMYSVASLNGHTLQQTPSFSRQYLVYQLHSLLYK